MSNQEKLWIKEAEFCQWANSKLLEYNLNDWQLMTMLPHQLDMLTGRKTKKSTVGTCFPNQKWIWISQQFIYEFKLHTSKEVFLHELAHAVTGEKHTKKFRDFCTSIGCKSIHARDNHYIFDMYGKYDVTPKQNQKCIMAYLKKYKML